MPRFFVSKTDISEREIILTGEDVRHMNVLRLRPGDSVTLCDGEKTDYYCVIKDITKEKVFLETKEIKENAAEPNVLITLFQSVAKGDKMDFIVQKSVELGVFEILPVYTRYSIPKNKNDKSDRLRKISEGAAKQSGRGIIPAVSQPMMFEDAIKIMPDYELFIVAYELEKTKTLKALLDGMTEKPEKIGVFIGPEGGFSEEEVGKLLDSGAVTVSLGNRILRTETAALSVMSVCNAYF